VRKRPCEFIVRQLAGALPRNLTVAPLGNGASITAVHQGFSIDTRMGLTPTGGLIMDTRNGDLDPCVIIHLMREMKLDTSATEELVDHRCGLLGISGVRSDMRTPHEAAGSSSDQQLAIGMSCYTTAKQVGAMSIALGGVDQIVFTGGIGQHDSQVLAAICARLSSLGMALDEARNNVGLGVVTCNASRCVVRVLPSEDTEQIARHTHVLCSRPGFRMTR